MFVQFLAVKEKKLTQREVLKELTKLNLSDKKSDKEFIKKFQNDSNYAFGKKIF